jgi:hypothetical protein
MFDRMFRISDLHQVVVYQDAYVHEHIDSQHEIKKVVNGYKVTASDVTDMILEHDDFKTKTLGLKVVKGTLELKQGQEALTFDVIRPNQRYAVYMLDKGNKYLVVVTYSYVRDRLKHFFAVPNEYNSMKTAFDLKYFTIKANKYPDVFNPYVRIKDAAKFTYHTRSFVGSFDKKTLNAWLKVVSNGRIVVESISSKKDTSGFHNYTDREAMHQFEIKLRLKNPTPQKISYDDLINLFDHSYAFRKDNEIIVLDYGFNSDPKVRGGVFKLNEENMIIDAVCDRDIWLKDRKRTGPQSFTDFKGYIITD